MYTANRSSSAFDMNSYVESKPDKKAEKAKAKQQRIKAARRKLMVYMAVFFAALFVILFRYVRVYDLHNEVAQQTRQLETIRMENEQIRLSIESMTDKTKIQNYAETELGLKKMSTAQIVYLNPVKENYMKNIAKGDSNESGAIKGFFAGFLEYLK